VPRDFTDALLMSLRTEPGLSMDHVMFELEDFIGGHSAVGNLVMLALSLLAINPRVAQAIRDEAHRVTGGHREVRLYDKPDMPYTEATLFETLRVLSSPIVPHVASEDTTIQGNRAFLYQFLHPSLLSLNLGYFTPLFSRVMCCVHCAAPVYY
jgi:cytochrome P450 family 307 subfamily A